MKLAFLKNGKIRGCMVVVQLYGSSNKNKAFLSCVGMKHYHFFMAEYCGTL